MTALHPAPDTSAASTPAAGRLELRSFAVRELELANRTSLEASRLLVDPREVEAELRRDERITSITVGVARPGESARIVHALDVVEPRDKLDGSDAIFPGFLGGPGTCGRGVTARLEGVAVVETADLGFFGQGMGVADAIVDMSGPGAAFSPFSRTGNLVLSIGCGDGVSFEERDAAIRLAGLRAARLLAQTAIGQTPADVTSYHCPPADPALPRVVYIAQVLSNAVLHEAFYYGLSLSTLLPALVDPAELHDGALVSANGHFACQRNPTYIHQNNPVVRELYRLHGRSINFVGVILAPSHRLISTEKERLAAETAKMARLLGADGAVITQGSGGHGAVDLMQVCQQCERLGIKTVVAMNELADADAADLATPDIVPEATAIVSTGNREEIVGLPAVERVLGGETLWDGSPAAAGLRLPLRHLLCSTNQLGFGRMRADFF